MEMNTPIGQNALDTSTDAIVGKPLDRVDGRLKVTGGAVYAYEVDRGPNTTYGYVVQASIGKGRIMAIDSSAAERAAGVILVLTYKNAPDQDIHPPSHPVLHTSEVSYYGQPVAFVVAEPSSRPGPPPIWCICATIGRRGVTVCGVAPRGHAFLMVPVLHQTAPSGISRALSTRLLSKST